jgi:hypothetical protein
MSFFTIIGYSYTRRNTQHYTPTDNVIGSALGGNEYGKPALGFLAPTPKTIQ